MSEFYDAKRHEIKTRIASWDTVNFDDLHMSREEAEQLMWDTCGRWVCPGDPQYDELRLLFYTNFSDIRPSMIAVCENVADVQCFLKYLRRSRKRNPKFDFTPRSGGHSTAGYSTVEGGVMLDLRGLNSITMDPNQELIHVGPGTQFRDFYRFLEAHGRFTPAGICPDVRVGGYMQGGGYGFGSRMFGMNCDNVVNLTVVLADGSVVQANENVNPDLFWAMRGGTGNNFGIVTQVTYKTYPAPPFGAISMRWRVGTEAEAQQGAVALDLMQRQFMGSNRDPRFGYMALIEFLEEPNGDKVPYLLMLTMYRGHCGLGSELLQELLNTPGCTKDWEKTGSYSYLNTELMSYSEVYEAPTELPSQEKLSRFVHQQVGVEGWRQLLDHVRSAESQFKNLPALNIESGGAAIDQTSRGENAYIHRNDDFNAFLNVYWTDEDGDANEEKALKYLYEWGEIIEQWDNQEAYQNYPKPYVTDWSARYWAEYYPCLCMVKEKYDPANLFRFEQSVGADGKCPNNAMDQVRSLLPELAEQLGKSVEYLSPKKE